MRIIAFLMSFFSLIVAIWNPYVLPNRIPETRTAPVYADGTMPDRFGVWPTEEFTEGPAPWWFSERVLRSMYARKQPIAPYHESLLVLHRGRLIYEYYAEGFDETTQFNIYSAIKSVLATLVGIAIHEGYIESVDQRAYEFFPEAQLDENDMKRDMTIEHLLTYTSGLDYGDEWWAADDIGLTAFLRPMRYQPGSRFTGGAAHEVLGTLLSRAVGQSPYDFAQQYLFGPLGATGVRNNSRNNSGSFNVHMTARDMARIGYLWLNFGRWEDAQLLCPHFMAQSPSRSMAPYGLGRSFTNNNLFPFFLTGSYEAAGMNGQYITVYPRLGMVVVRTGWTEVRTEI